MADLPSDAKDGNTVFNASLVGCHLMLIATGHKLTPLFSPHRSRFHFNFH